MIDTPIPLADQAIEVELCALGHADFIERFRDGKNRPPEEIERRRSRLVAFQAAVRTLKELAEKER